MRLPKTNQEIGQASDRGARLLGLKMLRRRRGMTQRELAEAADISQTTVYELEAGRRGAYPKTVRRLARGLKVEVEDLVGQ
jgi:DNA-binding XRE family transcriptional regulator